MRFRLNSLPKIWHFLATTLSFQSCIVICGPIMQTHSQSNTQALAPLNLWRLEKESYHIWLLWTTGWKVFLVLFAIFGTKTIKNSLVFHSYWMERCRLKETKRDQNNKMEVRMVQKNMTKWNNFRKFGNNDCGWFYYIEYVHILNYLIMNSLADT